MIKNRTTQLIFQTTYLAFGFIGILASLGFFVADFEITFMSILLIEVIIYVSVLCYLN